MLLQNLFDYQNFLRTFQLSLKFLLKNTQMLRFFDFIHSQQETIAKTQFIEKVLDLVSLSEKWFQV